MSVLNVRQSYSGGIFLTLLVAGGIYLIIFLLFLYIRKKRAPVLNSGRGWGGENEQALQAGAAFPHPLDFSNMLAWWLSVVRFPLTEIEAACGSSAYTYLWFQQQWLKLFAVASLASLLVLLPLNLQGGLSTQAAHFDQTTIAHIEGDSPALWIHVGFATACYVAALAIVRLWQSVWSGRVDADRRREKQEEDRRVLARKNELLASQRRASLNYYGNNRPGLESLGSVDVHDEARIEAALITLREPRFQEYRLVTAKGELAFSDFIGADPDGTTALIVGQGLLGGLLSKLRLCIENKT